jgi:AcrR family transcriptional regulator
MGRDDVRCPGPSSREERILDATEELLLRWGSRRVTVEEIARKAGVGKGTIYLHWPTKEVLFRDVVARDCGKALGQLVGLLRVELRAVPLSRTARLLLRLSMARPLYRCLNLRDTEILGPLCERAEDLPYRVSEVISHPDYLHGLACGGALREPAVVDDLGAVVEAVTEGFLTASVRLVGLQGHQLWIIRARQLEHVLRVTCESAETGTETRLPEAQGHILGYFTSLLRTCEMGATPLAAC